MGPLEVKTSYEPDSDGTPAELLFFFFFYLKPKNWKKKLSLKNITSL